MQKHRNTAKELLFTVQELKQEGRALIPTSTENVHAG